MSDVRGEHVRLLTRDQETSGLLGLGVRPTCHHVTEDP
jgi:hypothetical protein